MTMIPAGQDSTTWDAPEDHRARRSSGRIARLPLFLSIALAGCGEPTVPGPEWFVADRVIQSHDWKWCFTGDYYITDGEVDDRGRGPKSLEIKVPAIDGECGDFEKTDIGDGCYSFTTKGRQYVIVCQLDEVKKIRL